MQLSRFESSSDRTRLAGRTGQRGSQTGWSVFGLAVFSLPFLAIGVVIMLAGTGVIAMSPKNQQAPPWVLTIAGLIFALGGLIVLGMALRQHAVLRRRKEQAALHPDEPALADYGWDRSGFEAPRWSRPVRTLLAAVFLTVFLSIFNWWAFVAGGPWMVKAIVLVFDALLVACWWTFALHLGRALKFGGSRIEFAHFPCVLGEPVVLGWRPAEGISQVRGGTFTLRCIEEWWEQHGSGKNRSSRLVCECLWSGTWHVEEARVLEASDPLELKFELPPDARSTQLNPVEKGARSVFWELEARLDLPGLDFVESYLVPVYAPR